MQKTKLTSSYEPGQKVHLRIHMDEAGRGPLAGPVTVGAVIALKSFDRSAFKDSKILSEKKRELLYPHIQELQKSGSLVAATASSSNIDIDESGIIASQHSASVRAIFLVLKNYFHIARKEKLSTSVYGEDQIALTFLSKIFRKTKPTIDTIYKIAHVDNTICEIKSIIYDGNHTFGLEKSGLQVITIIKGDSKNPLISMASIIAKVDRDRYICKIAKKLPAYQLETHKGYGTAKHRTAIAENGISNIHRNTFCQNIKIEGDTPQAKITQKIRKKIQSQTKKIGSDRQILTFSEIFGRNFLKSNDKPALLLHICCAPDLSRPLHRLKNHFKLYLFRYNPNIHPRKEHTKRYDSFLKLIGLEKGDYEIIEDRYDPKEFFDAMIDQAETIKKDLSKESKKDILTVAGEMPERSDRCNPCYSMRLMEAAKNAAKHDIAYFTSTLLISPKKNMDKLFRRGIDSEEKYSSTKFLWFNFAKNKGYEKATKLTKKHKLFRQNYCGCGWTIPKPGDKKKSYRGG